MDKDSVKQALTSALSMLAFLARMTPTHFDDDVIVSLSVLAEKPWFIDFLVYVLNMLKSKDVPAAFVEELKAIVQSAAQQ